VRGVLDRDGETESDMNRLTTTEVWKLRVLSDIGIPARSAGIPMGKWPNNGSGAGARSAERNPLGHAHGFPSASPQSARRAKQEEISKILLGIEEILSRKKRSAFLRVRDFKLTLFETEPKKF